MLATIYVLSASTELFPLSSSCKALPENHWASYFHQASLGTHLNYQLFSNMVGRCKVQHVVDAEVCPQAYLFAYPFVLIGPTTSYCESWTCWCLWKVLWILPLNFVWQLFFLFVLKKKFIFLLFPSIFRKHTVADTCRP